MALAISPSTLVLSYGDTVQVSAFDRYSDGSTVDRTQDLVWTTSNATVATVSDTGSKGLVVGGTAGTATITATDLASGRSDEVTVMVTEAVITGLVVAPSTSSTPAGYGVQFSVTATYSDTATADVTDLATWSSSNEAVATVSNDPITSGLATGVAPGVAVVTATLPGGMSQTATITVTAAVLDSISVTAPAANLPKGIPAQLTATAHFSDLTTQDVTGFVEWSSSNPAVATVSNVEGSVGVVSGVAEGTATITATHGDKTASVGLTVTSATLTGIAVDASPGRPWTWAGTSTRFTATGTFSDGTVMNVTRAMTWTVSPGGLTLLSDVPGKANVVWAVTVTPDPVVITGTHLASGASGTFTWGRIRSRNR